MGCAQEAMNGICAHYRYASSVNRYHRVRHAVCIRKMPVLALDVERHFFNRHMTACSLYKADARKWGELEDWDVVEVMCIRDKRRSAT